MFWMYRVFRDQTGRYSVREVFYERDGTIITYSKAPVALVGDSPEEVLQLIVWCKEAFDLPILSMETVDAQIVARPTPPYDEQHPGLSLSLDEVRAALFNKTDLVQ